MFVYRILFHVIVYAYVSLISNQPTYEWRWCVFESCDRDFHAYLGDLYMESGPTLQASFSSVSKPIFQPRLVEKLFPRSTEYIPF